MDERRRLRVGAGALSGAAEAEDQEGPPNGKPRAGRGLQRNPRAAPDKLSRIKASTTMSESSRTPPSAATLESLGTVSPFLHDRGQSLYNPLSGVEIAKTDPRFQALTHIGQGRAEAVDPVVITHLRAERFLIDDIHRESRRTHLLYLSLETCTVCNHRCPFCPVSVEPRDREVMTQELFESVVDQAVEAGGDKVIVFLNNYNEPTFDPLFEDRVRYLFSRKLAVSILTNASGFTPERCALFESLGRFRYIGVNLPDASRRPLREAPRDAGSRPCRGEHGCHACPGDLRGDGDRGPGRRG